MNVGVVWYFEYEPCYIIVNNVKFKNIGCGSILNLKIIIVKYR